MTVEQPAGIPAAMVELCGTAVTTGDPAGEQGRGDGVSSNGADLGGLQESRFSSRNHGKPRSDQSGDFACLQVLREEAISSATVLVPREDMTCL